MGELKIEILCKDKQNVVYRQGKRRLTSKKEVLTDMKKDLWRLFGGFKGAINEFNNVYAQKPIHERIRNYEAVNFNQCLVSNAFNVFPNECFFGKYKVFFMRVKGYKILFKKLAANGKPMNIQTGNINNIANQAQLNLFGDLDYIEPILFFGYKRDRLGNFIDPQIVYIDGGDVKFVINEYDIQNIVFQDDTNGSERNDVGNNDVKVKNSNIKKIN